MKTRLLIVITVLFGINASAQKYKGILVGVNSGNTLNVAEARGGGLTGLVVGGFIGADRSEKRSEILELNVRTLGFGSNYGKVRLYYANVTLLMAYRIFNNPDIRLSFGLQPTLYLGKNEPSQPNRQYPIYCADGNCFQAPRPLNMDVMGGIEYWGKARVSLRFGYGLISQARFKNSFVELAIGI